MRQWIRGLCVASAVVVAVLMPGCASSQNASTPHVLGDPSKVKPQTEFEASQDPPVQAKTFYAAGRFAETQGDYKKAIEQYWKAVKLDGHCMPALFRLGVVYTELKQYSEATVAWKMYLKADDHSATGYSNLGFCYEMAGRASDAEGAYKDGIKRDPRNAPCRVNYGILLARMDRESEAILQLQQVLPPAQVYYDIASVYDQQGKKQQAKAQFEKALALDPHLNQAVARLEAMK